MYMMRMRHNMCSSLCSSEGKEVQEKLLQELNAKVRTVYVECGFDADAKPTTLTMLTDLEGKLEFLLAEMETMDLKYVETAEKVRPHACTRSLIHAHTNLHIRVHRHTYTIQHALTHTHTHTHDSSIRFIFACTTLYLHQNVFMFVSLYFTMPCVPCVPQTRMDDIRSHMY